MIQLPTCRFTPRAAPSWKPQLDLVGDLGEARPVFIVHADNLAHLKISESGTLRKFFNVNVFHMLMVRIRDLHQQTNRTDFPAPAKQLAPALALSLATQLRHPCGPDQLFLC
jgi:hypothetical protein